ncbi:nuclear GTPase SLIP-GC-like [Parambassis ranga]|uniref:Nuclear GTPase SLIP-GC-like n=1 Tax=Parambassis ranga TaxID=210632 RepID=A0A6P7IQV8_9TELE|nr:nuclear GTPase SLIP-GC-like [Parambassis ranga]
MDNSKYVKKVCAPAAQKRAQKRAAGAAAAEDKNEYRDIKEKLSALYREEWKQKIQIHENLMNPRYFREMPEFINSKTKTLSADTAKELSEQFAKYTRTHSKQGGNKEESWYWPLVKSVTVKVPNNDLLQHVTLVDLPVNGDRNKSRDEMWKEIVGDCSAVWIVTDINRAASETEAWKILKGAASLIGNGGQCQYIHFICTKSDCIEEADDKQQTKGQCGPFNGVINSFSLGTEGLIEKYKDVELQLTFLKTEEDKMKTRLNRMIRDKNKLIYRSLTETIKTNMQTSYEKAATFSGPGSLDNMRFTLQKHVHDSKDTMFKQAGETMLKKLKDLKEEILGTLEETMMESIDLSLKTDDHSIPDVSAELVEVKS